MATSARCPDRKGRRPAPAFPRLRAPRLGAARPPCFGLTTLAAPRLVGKARPRPDRLLPYDSAAALSTGHAAVPPLAARAATWHLVAQTLRAPRPGEIPQSSIGHASGDLRWQEDADHTSNPDVYCPCFFRNVPQLMISHCWVPQTLISASATTARTNATRPRSLLRTSTHGREPRSHPHRTIASLRHGGGRSKLRHVNVAQTILTVRGCRRDVAYPIATAASRPATHN